MFILIDTITHQKPIQQFNSGWFRLESRIFVKVKAWFSTHVASTRAILVSLYYCQSQGVWSGVVCRVGWVLGRKETANANRVCSSLLTYILWTWSCFDCGTSPTIKDTFPIVKSIKEANYTFGCCFGFSLRCRRAISFKRIIIILRGWNSEKIIVESSYCHRLRPYFSSGVVNAV